MPLSGSRTGGSTSSHIPGLEVGYMRPCIFSLAFSPISLMQTAALATDPCHDLFPELSPSHYLLSHMIAVTSPSSHSSPSLLTDPPQLFPTCPKGPHTPIPQLWQ